jgi:prepilin-type N-terminal cleavage/methylation domain-containing protein
MQFAYSKSDRRSGFTLIELLIVITIIAVLATLVVGVAMVAGQTGRDAKTRNVVGRIHTLLIEHYDSFKTRRIELNPAVVDLIQKLPSPTYSSADRGKITAAARLYALREMMLLEMPDRWSDLVLDVAGNTPPPPAYLAARTALSDALLRRFLSLIDRVNSLTGSVNTTEEILANQGAECLYLVVTVACGDGEARTQFHDSDIGDVDGDGAPEFLDAWGHPISYIRWAPGLNSPIQINANEFSGLTDPDWAAAAASDHDPFDIFRLQPNAFRLSPYVYSAGRDEYTGFEPEAEYVSADYVVWFSKNPVRPIGTIFPFFDRPLDPYVKVSTGTQKPYLGTEDANHQGESTDNIHNHLIGRRL